MEALREIAMSIHNRSTSYNLTEMLEAVVKLRNAAIVAEADLEAKLSVQGQQHMQVMEQLSAEGQVFQDTLTRAEETGDRAHARAVSVPVLVGLREVQRKMEEELARNYEWAEGHFNQIHHVKKLKESMRDDAMLAVIQSLVNDPRLA